jgi:hypothetical protein
MGRWTLDGANIQDGIPRRGDGWGGHVKGSEIIEAPGGGPTYEEIGFLSKHRSQSLVKDSMEESEGMVRRLSRPNRHPQNQGRDLSRAATGGSREGVVGVSDG